MTKSQIINIVDSDNVDTWFDDGILYIRLGFITLQLDKELAHNLYIALENTNQKLNELNLELKDFESTT